jgi:hypothetical protein
VIIVLSSKYLLELRSGTYPITRNRIIEILHKKEATLNQSGLKKFIRRMAGGFGKNGCLSQYCLCFALVYI